MFLSYLKSHVLVLRIIPLQVFSSRVIPSRRPSPVKDSFRKAPASRGSVIGASLNVHQARYESSGGSRVRISLPLLVIYASTRLYARAYLQSDARFNGCLGHVFSLAWLHSPVALIEAQESSYRIQEKTFLATLRCRGSLS